MATTKKAQPKKPAPKKPAAKKNDDLEVVQHMAKKHGLVNDPRSAVNAGGVCGFCGAVLH